jgi:hypothetical protein
VAFYTAITLETLKASKPAIGLITASPAIYVTNKYNTLSWLGMKPKVKGSINP